MNVVDPEASLGQARARPRRVLVICPSWVGDVVMATPAIRLIRDALPGAFLGALVRPGLDEVLAGTSLFDEVHVDRARGMMGPKHVATKLRPRAYDAAVLLTNSFSTALIARLAFIPRRIGYDREARGLLLTDRLKPERRGVLGYKCVPAVEYYLRLARLLIGDAPASGVSTTTPRLELGVTPAQDAAGKALLLRAGVGDGQPFAVLIPGANDHAKRWPAERFAAIATDLSKRYGLAVLISGAPAEAELCDAVVGIARNTSGGALSDASMVSLPSMNVTLGSLKPLLKDAALLVTNDTGPRHIAAAFGTPTLTLFGPTDPRWTTLPPESCFGSVAGGTPRRIDLVADPSLPPELIADDHPDRCRIDLIALETVRGAVNTLLGEAKAASSHQS